MKLLRGPVAPAAQGKGLLVSIGVSHFNEKVRWLCRIGGIPFEEQASPPVVHFLSVPVFTRGTLPGAKMATPILFLPGEPETPIQESDAISLMLFRKGYLTKAFMTDASEAATAAGITEETLSTLGHAVRTIAYYNIILKSEKPLYSKVVKSRVGGGTWLPKLVDFPGVMAVTRAMVAMVTKIESKENVARKYTRIEEWITKISAVLESTAKSANVPLDTVYLSGTDKPSILDVTFASLAYPLLLPPEMSWVVDLSEPMLDQSFRDRVLDWRATPAGAHCLRMFATHMHSVDAASSARSNL